jgi:predicted GTPase
VRLLRSTGKTVLVAANKVDAAKLEADAAEFHRFGFDDVVPVSAEIGDGVAELLDALVERLPPQDADEMKSRKARARSAARDCRPPERREVFATESNTRRGARHRLARRGHDARRR